MTDLATLAVRLSEAEAALHNMLSAKTPVELNDGTSSVRYSYSPLGIKNLEAHIRRLKNEIAAASGVRRRFPLGVRF